MEKNIVTALSLKKGTACCTEEQGIIPEILVN